jgi:proteic killer suppression protein
VVDLEYADARVERICTDEKFMRREVGVPVAKTLRRRIAELRAASTLDDLLLGVGKWERLHGDRAGQWSSRLSANWRLIVEQTADDGTAARVVGLEDYH